MNFGQLMMIGVQGTELSPEEEKFIVENNIGGVILFTRNFESVEQLWDLNRQIQRLRFKQKDQAPLFVAVDQEGGRVQRFKDPFTIWPALAKIGEIGSPTVAFQFAQSLGMELRSVGINVNFAPCVDVFSNTNNKVIGDRAVSSDPEEVAKIGSALVRGFIKSEILPCAKHFPGHGDTIIDSHDDLPVESTDLNTLAERELVPFKKVFRARLDLVMTAHIKFSSVDADNPVTLSERFLKQIVRDDLRYRGLVISDDLDMKALASHYDKADIPVQALKAGCDMMLYCNEPDSPPVAVDAVAKAIAEGNLDKAALQESVDKVLKVKKKSLGDFDTMPLEDALEIIENPLHKELAASIEKGSVATSLLEKLAE